MESLPSVGLRKDEDQWPISWMAIFNKFLTDGELEEEKVVQFAAEVTNRFTLLEAAQYEVTPEDL